MTIDFDSQKVIFKYVVVCRRVQKICNQAWLYIMKNQNELTKGHKWFRIGRSNIDVVLAIIRNEETDPDHEKNTLTTL